MFSKGQARSLFLFAFLFLIALSTKAQPILPDIIGATDKGINVISWTCQYEGIKSIAVQRSSDSVYNYVTVGYVKNLKKGPQAFIDGHPVPRNNWYRLYIVFNSDLTWYSNRFKIYVDSAAIAAKGVLPPNDSLQKLASKIKIDTSAAAKEGATTVVNPGTKDSVVVPRLTIAIPQPDEISAYSYVKSQYVFTNPFTGHINLELPDFRQHHYSVKFFDNKDREVLDIPRVTDSPIIIDKRNFQRKGLYKFELRQDRNKMETGYITIY